MNRTDKNAAVLWTGGKDSSLALLRATRARYRVRSLVTFTPRAPNFLAHPVNFIAEQAHATGIPHRCIEIAEPFKDGYLRAIHSLRELGMETLVTGDIAEVEGHPNWILECGEQVGMRVLMPLWGADRQSLLEELLAEKFGVVFSLVKTPWLDASWVGRELDSKAVTELRAIHTRNGFDLCGENGEYHTLVTDAPFFRERIAISGFSRRTRNGTAHIVITRTELLPK